MNSDGSKLIAGTSGRLNYFEGTTSITNITSNPLATTYNQLFMNSEGSKFMASQRKIKNIILYTNNAGTWTNKNPINGNPSVITFTLTKDWSMIAYINDVNDVYTATYDASTDLYINPVKVTLSESINNFHSLQFSPNGGKLAVFYQKLYIYKLSNSVYTYLQTLTYNNLLTKLYYNVTFS
jgi:hypothetical protein